MTGTRVHQISFKISEERLKDLEEIKHYYLSRYNTLKGIGDEIIRLAKLGLEIELAGEEKKVKQPLTHVKYNKRHVALLKYIILNFPHEVTRTDIKTFVVRNYGTDERTINRYIRFLLEFGFIKVKKPMYKEVLYEVNLEKALDFLRKVLEEEEFKVIQSSVIHSTKPIIENKGNGEKESVIEAAKACAAERYEMGDTIEEICERLADFGLDLTKQSVRNFVRKALREVRE